MNKKPPVAAAASLLAGASAGVAGELPRVEFLNSGKVKRTIMLADIAEWAAFNEVYETCFAAPPIAGSAAGRP